MCISIEINEKTGVWVSSPYHPDLPSRARQLGGKWAAASKMWVFDLRDESRVRDLYRAIYGTDGSDAGDTVTVRARYTAEVACHASQAAYFLGSVELARAFGRDSGARISQGIIVLEGSFFSSGSRKNWTTAVSPGTVVEIRDLPRGQAQSLTEADWQIEIIESETIDREALQDERERLLARIAEIEALLK